MQITGKDIFWAGVTGMLGYTFYRVIVMGDTITDAFSRLWDATTFDASTIPKVELTPAAIAQQQDWIQRGFLEIDATGRSHITPAGEAYIKRQKEKIVNPTINP